MASSSDTFSSALSYALELLGTTNLTLNEERRKSLEAVYQGNSVSYGTDRIWQEHLLPSFVIEYKKGQHGSTLCYCHDHVFYV